METNKLFSPLFGLSTSRSSPKSFYRSITSTLLFTISGIMLFNSQLIAQNFFPLKVGNIYQVEDDWWFVGPGGYGESGTDYYSLTVVKDTIIGGETFYTLSCNFGNFSFNREHLFRYDYLNQKLLIRLPNDTTARLAVDFNAPADSHYISFIRGEAEEYISNGFSYQIVLGDTHLVYSMEDPEIPRHWYNFADDFGFIKFEYYFGWSSGASSSEHNVISAIIDSVIYNPLTLKIDTLYPVEDRPVDTFPYLLTIPYSASYPALLDSFCLDAQQLRSDTLVQTKRFYLSDNNPSHLSFYLAGLLPGDKIKFRTTITDTSIFNNVDHYPDSGWVVMNVLPPILNVEIEDNPLYFELTQNYPNPFNPATTIWYLIPEAEFVTIKVYDVLGNEISTLVDQEKIAGNYAVEFDGSNLTSGIYYYRITAGNFSQTKKMILIK